ncbi:metal-dependent hydrolase [Virgibacillus sp. 179-BFC.A HS]|uniref:Metal-dependent hydrolase n=1 Tax=Tigheibacillus jepli TaxID=3035914 RepID=A0ABU5CKK4_9BACI|nr:metal-dependent hydrolase [Virgibacillus sp. 179-BFC.A HS]MDY0406878.1 metal-dependent hydrolase [Virgibacillus sp. 179-BFC.A HS]
MDTGTHIVMGVALGGLATLDPAVQSDPLLFNCVLAGTLIGSNAPDFDTVLKLKNNATYIRNHRGITHSVPAVLFWGIAVASVIHALVPEVSFLHLWAWTFLAVILHVLVDIFNAYGTQAYRPFSNRWVAYGFINTFDPYIFGLHIVGIIAWIIGANPGYTWLAIYGVIFLYYIKRYVDKREIVKKIKDYFPNTIQIATSPTMKQNNWRVAVTTTDKFYVGTVSNGHIEIIDEFNKVPLPKTEIMDLVSSDSNISAFLSFSPVYRWEINEYDDYTEIRFIDLRYRSKGYYPFVAVVQVDKNKHIMNSYTGWIYSERKLKRKLFVGDNPI